MPPTATPPILATLVCGKAAAREFEAFLFSLSLWHTGNDVPRVYVFSDTETKAAMSQFKYPADRLHINTALNAYAGKTRQEMEQQTGRRFKTLWTDLMCEKLNCLRWAFEEEPEAATHGVFFADCDILFLAPLPLIPPGTKVALAPHLIKRADTDKYGYYNGGFGWFARASLCDIWETATHTSRFFEQAALEEVAHSVPPAQLYEFPIQHDFGWWRMFQSDGSVETISSHFGFYRSLMSSGITYNGKTLASVHSHWADTTDLYNASFNQFLLKKLELLKNSHPPANRLYHFLKTHF